MVSKTKTSHSHFRSFDLLNLFKTLQSSKTFFACSQKIKCQKGYKLRKKKTTTFQTLVLTTHFLLEFQHIPSLVWSITKCEEKWSQVMMHKIWVLYFLPPFPSFFHELFSQCLLLWRLKYLPWKQSYTGFF
jgi:hypothetical protein